MTGAGTAPAPGSTWLLTRIHAAHPWWAIARHQRQQTSASESPSRYQVISTPNRRLHRLCAPAANSKRFAHVHRRATILFETSGFARRCSFIRQRGVAGERTTEFYGQWFCASCLSVLTYRYHAVFTVSRYPIFTIRLTVFKVLRWRFRCQNTY